VLWIIAVALLGLLPVALYSCSDDDETAPDNHFEYGTVADIDGNAYRTVVIGEQEWMVENLRVTRYTNGDPIPTDFNDHEWENTTEGAYAIYPHDSITGFHTAEEVLEAYGALYNWHAVQTGSLCPEGWSVPSDGDWTQLVDSLMAKHDLHNLWGISDVDGVGNALKSCRQANSPLGGGFNTSRHPRWDPHDTHYGMNAFGLSLLPGGSRIPSGEYFLLGTTGYWWSADEHSVNYAWSREASKDLGNLGRYFPDKSSGFSVRCIRD